jgi:hypothetical protein
MGPRAKLVALSLAGLAIVAMSSLSASARIICNPDGDCWHAQEEYAYPPSVGFTIHPDDWRWKEGEHYSWKEHPGRGYWSGGAWRAF